MTDTRTRLEPGPDHPITIHPETGHVTVRRGARRSSQRPTAPSHCAKPTIPRCSTSRSPTSISNACAPATSTPTALTRERPRTTTFSPVTATWRVPCGTTPTPTTRSKPSAVTSPSTPTASPSPANPEIERRHDRHVAPRIPTAGRPPGTGSSPPPTTSSTPRESTPSVSTASSNTPACPVLRSTTTSTAKSNSSTRT